MYRPLINNKRICVSDVMQQKRVFKSKGSQYLVPPVSNVITCKSPAIGQRPVLQNFVSLTTSLRPQLAK